MKLDQALKKLLQANSSLSTKQWFENYTKQQERFLGLKTPQLEALLKNFLHTVDDGDLLELAQNLLFSAYTEERLAGMLILQKRLIPRNLIGTNQLLETIEELFEQEVISWWNSCDWLCIRVLAPLIKRDGPLAAKRIINWKSSNNLWQARAGLVAFVPIAKAPSQVYSDCLQDITTTASYLVRSPERFHQTAVGWTMREVGKGNAEVLRQFVRTEIAHFSAEGLRYAVEKLAKHEILAFRELRTRTIKETSVTH